MDIKDAVAIAGLILLLDDIKDLGKVDRPHHWQLGAAMILKPEWFENILNGTTAGPGFLDC